MKDKLRELAESWKQPACRNGSSHECADELLALIDAEGDGGAAAWQYRYKNDRIQWSRWRHWEIEGREDQFPKMIGRWEVEYRQLYTHPARSGVVSDEDV